MNIDKDQLGYHYCTNDWSIRFKYITLNKIEKKIPVMKLYEVAKVMRVVPFDQICVKPLNVYTSRYVHADFRFPGILAEDVENPCNLKYRLCDGRHRIYKMKNHGLIDGVFLIITREDFMKVFNSVP